MNLHKKTFLFGFFSILLLGSVSALQIGGSRGGSCENAFCNLADDIVYWGNLQNIPATLAYLNQQNTFTAAQTFQTKVNAFDLNVGHDLNVGNDLNVVRDANATRFCLPDGNCWSSGEIITNTLGNSKYWRLDGTSAPPTANWNMGDYNFTGLQALLFTDNILLGNSNSSTLGSNAILIGNNSTGTQGQTTTIGTALTNNGAQTLLYGTDSIAYESCVNSIMLLDTGECSAPYSVGGGYNAFITSVDAAVCWGEGVNCSGEMVSGLGAFTILSGVHSTGVGQSIDISGDYGVGIGSDITVSNDNSMVLGRSFSSSDENVLYSTHKAFVINGDVNANRFCFPDGTCMTSAGISETDTNDLILWDLDSNYLVPKQGWDINMGDDLLNLDTDLNKIIIGASSSPNTTKVRISDSTNTFATLFGLDRNISSRQINTIDFSVNTTLSYVGASVSGLGHVIGNYTFYDNRKITSGVADAVQSMFMQVSRGSDFNSVSRAHTMNGLYLSVSDSGTYSAPTPVPPIALVTTATGSNITTSSFFKSDLGVGKTLTYNLTGMKLDGSSNYTLVSGALNYNYKGIDITLAGDTEGLSKGYAFYSDLTGFDERWNIYNDSDSNNFMGSGDTNFSDNFHFRADGNVTMKSPDGSFWNCGVTNAGTFQCSTP